MYLTVQSWDSFWVDTFHRCYVEDGKKGRDDLLFYVKVNSKQVLIIVHEGLPLTDDWIVSKVN